MAILVIMEKRTLFKEIYGIQMLGKYLFVKFCAFFMYDLSVQLYRFIFVLFHRFCPRCLLRR